jgi:1-phosphofructokinase family hexose kinase
MILSVTLNACLDKTLTVPPWRPGDLVRGHAVREVVGGKGNNVARALARLGRTARPVTPLGGAVGARCAELLRTHDGLDPIVVPTAAVTREILTVRTAESDAQTAFFDPDPAITADEAEAIHKAVEGALDAGQVELITLSGSSPSPATHRLYSELIALARSRRLPAFLDTYGPALDEVWGFWPDVLQLNRREAAGHLDGANPGDEAVFELLADWARHGVQVGVVTDGARPALVQARGERFRVTPPAIEAVNPIGSGDCLLAGLADGWLSGLDTEALLRHGFGCAVANALVWDAGAIDGEAVAAQAAAIEIEPLGPVPTNGAVNPLVRKGIGKKR